MKLISIIITTYNRFDFLKKTIQTVQNQTYPNKEIIIIDDCSTDERYTSLKNYKEIYYLRNNDNRGASESRKSGIKVAKGDYVIFVDDDDFYIDNEFFSKCISIFERNVSHNLAFVSANANLYIDEENSTIKGEKLDFNGFVDRKEYLSYFQYKYRKPYSTFTTMFEFSIIRKVNMNTYMFNDSSIYIKALLYGNAWFLDDIIGSYRIHKSNISKGLNFQFLLDNLKEKYIASKDLNISIDTDEWLFHQYSLTCEYFMRESLPSFKENIALLSWNLNHLSSFKFKILFLKCWAINIIYEVKNTFHIRS